MNVHDLIIFNFEEVRRRSIKVWKAIPEQMLNWKPDKDALTCAEMIRHLLEGEFLYHQILIGRGSKALSNLTSPFETKEFTTVDAELAFAQPYREEFIKYIRSISIYDLENAVIDRSDVGYVRKLGDMFFAYRLSRICSHWAIVRLHENNGNRPS